MLVPSASAFTSTTTQLSPFRLSTSPTFGSLSLMTYSLPTGSNRSVAPVAVIASLTPLPKAWVEERQSGRRSYVGALSLLRLRGEGELPCPTERLPEPCEHHEGGVERDPTLKGSPVRVRASASRDPSGVKLGYTR